MPPKNGGYHPIESIFQQVNLYDEIKIELSQEGKDVVEYFDSNNIRICIDNCIIKKVLNYYFRRKDPYFRIVVKKNIPMGSGLGGASSNAAVVIQFLKKEGLISTVNMLDIASKIGADVPFFIKGGRCFVEGIGERVFESHVQKRDVYLVIVPPLHIATKEIYNALDRVATYSSFGDFNKECLDYLNDFKDIIWVKYPIYQRIESVLSKFGLPLYLSGTGASCYLPLKNKGDIDFYGLNRDLYQYFPHLKIYNLHSL